tara:strand:+ start:2600 stop:2794 length:195 start_codon:yes stop_codon:yes gene_type:complete
MAKYDATEIILSILYYSGGNYSPDQVLELMEVIALYHPEANSRKKSNLEMRIVPINTNEFHSDE